MTGYINQISSVMKRTTRVEEAMNMFVRMQDDELVKKVMLKKSERD